MSDYTQAQQTLLAHQEMTHPASVVGSAIDVSSQLAGIVYIWQANIETTANLAARLDYIDIQISPDASGNNWHSYLKLAPSTTASSTVALNGAAAQGATTLPVSSNTNFDASDLIYIKDATGVSSSEWAQIISLTSTTAINIADGLAVAKEATNDSIYDQASRWAIYVDLCGVQRLRVVAVHQGATGSDWRIMSLFESATDVE